MILVTGSTGNVGTQVIKQLAEKSTAVRAMTRQSTFAPFAGYSSVELFQADFCDGDRLLEAMKDIDAVVLISPADESMVKDQVAVVDAALKSDVKKIVKLSGLGAGPDAGIKLAQAHYAIENHIVASGINHTFVRPNLFMQVLPGNKPTIDGDGKIYAPMGDGSISFIDTRDVAAVIVASLADDSESVYEITGPQAFSFKDVANMISVVSDQNVDFVNVSEEQAKQSMLSGGVSAWVADALLELFAVYRNGGGNVLLNDVVAKCKGRVARDLPSFIGENFSC